MKKILDEISKIQSKISNLSKYIEKYKTVVRSSFTTLIPPDESLNTIQTQFKEKCNEIHERTKKLNEKIGEVREKHGEESTDYIALKNHIERLSNNLQIEINKLRREEQKYMDSHRKKLKTIFVALTPNATDEEIREFEASEDPEEILRVKQNRKEKKNEEIKRIVARIEELNELISQTEIIMGKSEKKLDKIEESYSKSVELTDKGVKELTVARKLQLMAMRWKRFIVIFVIIAIIGGIIFVAVVFIYPKVQERIDKKKGSDTSQ